MTLIPVDTTGILTGETLQWNGVKFVRGPAIADAAIVATTRAGLGSPTIDGRHGIIRLGTSPNVYEEHFFWDLAHTKWVGTEKVIVTQQDNWAMDLGDRNATDLLNWSAIQNAVPYGKAFAIIQGALNLSASNFDPATHTGVITVDDTTSPHSHAFTDSGGAGGSPPQSNYLFVRDNIIAYTGRTSTTFTGCQVVQGPRGTIPTKEYITQGFVGGWGFVVEPIHNAAALFAAGFQLQERLTCLCNSSFFISPATEKKLNVAPYWYQYDPGDGQLPPQRQVPPSGGLGVSAILQSPSGSSPGAPGAERSFYVTMNSWSDWPLADPTKFSLIPMMVGKMEASGVYSGSILDTKLTVRWTS
jgi:hypothetical protein